MKERNSGERMIVDVRKGTFTPKLKHSEPRNAHSTLYVKDKYAISNETYHQLNMLSIYPHPMQYKVEHFTKFEIFNSKVSQWC